MEDNWYLFPGRYGTYSVSTLIPIQELEQDLIVNFNPTSSLYNEATFEESKSPLRPFEWNRWYMSNWYYDYKDMVIRRSKGIIVGEIT